MPGLSSVINFTSRLNHKEKLKIAIPPALESRMFDQPKHTF